MAATETRTREQLAAALAEIASHEIWPLTISPQEAALLLDALEPKKPAFEGWADVELMGHRQRIAYVREFELAHRGFLELTWREGELDHREIYSPSAVFCLTPIAEPLGLTDDDLNRNRDDIPF